MAHVTRSPLTERIATLVNAGRWAGSQTKFAADVGCSPSVISKILAGKQSPGSRLLQRICRLERVNPAWLLSGEGQPWLADQSAVSQLGPFVVEARVDHSGRLQLQVDAIVSEAEESSTFVFDGTHTVTDYLDDLRIRIFQEALRRTHGRCNAAAKLLGVSPAAVSKFARRHPPAQAYTDPTPLVGPPGPRPDKPAVDSCRQPLQLLQQLLRENEQRLADAIRLLERTQS